LTPQPTPPPTPLPTALLGLGAEPQPTPPPTPPPTQQPTPPLTPQPTPGPTPAPPLPSGDFYLKMYWKKGYTWQEQTREFKWCVKCSGDSCNDDDKLKLNECDGKKDEWRFVPVAGTNNKQIFIKYSSKDLCWRYTTETEGSHSAKIIRLDGCDEDDDRQKWETKGNGEWHESKFEIYPILEDDSCADGRRSGCHARCVNQMHHPKDEEYLWAEDCSLARRDSTSLWEILR